MKLILFTKIHNIYKFHTICLFHFFLVFFEKSIQEHPHFATPPLHPPLHHPSCQPWITHSFVQPSILPLVPSLILFFSTIGWKCSGLHNARECSCLHNVWLKKKKPSRYGPYIGSTAFTLNRITLAALAQTRFQLPECRILRDFTLPTHHRHITKRSPQ